VFVRYPGGAVAELVVPEGVAAGSILQFKVVVSSTGVGFLVVSVFGEAHASLLSLLVPLSFFFF